MQISSKNEPTDPGLWAKVQALAKGEKKSISNGGKTVNGPNDGSGFKVFPSAYANGWASKVYKDLGGGWKKKASVGKHTLPPLPYGYDALEPHISEETLRFHHDKHHQAYVDGLNKAEKALAEAREFGDYGAVPALNRVLEFNSGGNFLHTLYWTSLLPAGSYAPPSKGLVDAVQRDFGSWESFRAQIKEATVKVRGSGWGVLVATPSGMRILTVMNHENGVLWDGEVLLPMDSWEHAYYLDYQNDRGAYFDAVFDNLINWAAVELRLLKSRSAQRVASKYKKASTGDGSEHVGVFAPLPADLAGQFPEKDEDSSVAHVTLCYIGPVPDKQDQKVLVEAVRDLYADVVGPIKARLSGVDYFRSATGSVAYTKVVFSKDMGSLKDRLKSLLEDHGIKISDDHPLAFNPHVTLAYYEDPHAVWDGPVPKGSWTFNEVEVWGLPKIHRLPVGAVVTQPVGHRSPRYGSDAP